MNYKINIWTMILKAKLYKENNGWKVKSRYGVIFLPEFEGIHLDNAIEKERKQWDKVMNDV